MRVTISSCLQYFKDNCFVRCHNRIPHLLHLQEANVADIFASLNLRNVCRDHLRVLSVCICLCSGVGTVAAIAALVATLFRPKINIHNLL